MLGFSPTKDTLDVLCLGAHPDDIEIGCGGTLLYLQASYRLCVTWVVLSGNEARQQEARESANAFLEGAQQTTLHLAEFRESYFPYQSGLKDYFQNLGRTLTPDLIFTHYRRDRHQDHRTVSELTWNTFRKHLVLEYEIPKYDGDLGRPNVFVPLPETVKEKKLRLLMAHFETQRSKPWYDRETFSALLRLRGMECQAESRHAEAFYGRKLRLG